MLRELIREKHSARSTYVEETLPPDATSEMVIYERAGGRSRGDDGDGSRLA